jgi:uncharacterized protein involved in exopolysaccharide biosynthesis
MGEMPTEDFLRTFPEEDPALGEAQPPREGGPSPGPRFGQFVAPTGFSMRELARFVFKHKWALLIPMVLATTLGTAYSLVARPWFQAVATIQIQPNELEALTPTGNQARQKNLLNDQVQVLRSDSMLERVVQALSLDTRMVALFDEDVLPADRVTGAIRILKENVLFIQPVIDTNFITIIATAPTADLAYRVPNTLAEEYVNTVRNRIAGKATSLTTLYDEEANKGQEDLNNVSKRIAEFLEQHGISDMAQRFQSLQSQAERLEQDLRDASRDELRMKTRIEALENELKKEPATIASTTQITVNPQYQQIRQYYEGLQLERTNSLSMWQKGSRKVQALDQQIAEASQTLSAIPPETVAGKLNIKNPRHEQIKDELALLRPQMEATHEEIQFLNGKIEKVNSDLSEFVSLKQEYSELLAEKMRLSQQVEFARQRGEQTRTTGAFATEIAEVKISDPARKPLGPSGPNTALIVLLSVAFGFGIGVGLSVLRELLGHAIETVEDVHKHLGLPVLGAIPEKAFR